MSNYRAEWNSAIDGLDLIDIYGLFHPSRQNTHSTQTHTEHQVSVFPQNSYVETLTLSVAVVRYGVSKEVTRVG